MPQQRWFKGNIHTHTNAGGARTGYPHGDPAADSDPETVTAWYRRHGYDFLVLSDHNHRTLLDYGTGKRRFRRPLMIPGEEVSIRIEGGTKAVHLGAVGITRVVEPIDATGVVATLQANVNAIRKAGGIAAINHPNFTWAFDHEAISQVRGAHLLEVFNGHPRVNVYGAGGRLGYEEIWDNVLSTGLPIWGVATDDSHQFKGAFGPHRINPGRGWVMVRAPDLEVGLHRRRNEGGRVLRLYGRSAGQVGVGARGDTFEHTSGGGCPLHDPIHWPRRHRPERGLWPGGGVRTAR